MLSWIRHTLGERDYSCREEKCNITLIGIHRDIGERVTFIKIKKQCQGKRKINNFSELTTQQRQSGKTIRQNLRNPKYCSQYW